MPNFPGGSSEPEIMAAKVSRIICLVFSMTGAGRGRSPAEAMYSLRVVIMGLMGAAARRRATGARRAVADSRASLLDMGRVIARVMGSILSQCGDWR